MAKNNITDYEELFYKNKSVDKSRSKDNNFYQEVRPPLPLIIFDNTRSILKEKINKVDKNNFINLVSTDTSDNKFNSK